MASPSPVPPYFREVEESACVNLLKIIFCSSGDIPIPESSTVTVIFTWWASAFSVRSRSFTHPSSVNFIALCTRLVITWVIRVGSPDTSSGIRSSTSYSSLSFLLPAKLCSPLIICFPISRRFISIFSSGILSASSLL